VKDPLTNFVHATKKHIYALLRAYKSATLINNKNDIKQKYIMHSFNTYTSIGTLMIGLFCEIFYDLITEFYIRKKQSHMTWAFF